MKRLGVRRIELASIARKLPKPRHHKRDAREPKRARPIKLIADRRPKLRAPAHARWKRPAHGERPLDRLVNRLAEARPKR